MERKLATVLFADLVGSTGLVAVQDPEIVRRRLYRFFKAASNCIEAHGGKVEKFAGDAVMAAFGVPRVHEDDAVRALKAALAIRDSVEELGLEVRIGVEAGEVVVDDVASTFATGAAVNTAARLQQLAGPGEILAGPVVRELADRAIEFAALGGQKLRGLHEQSVWRVIAPSERQPESSSPFVGREDELELLENVYGRVVKQRRPHLVTVYGDPGVGKSRLVREFVSSAEGATVLFGRTLPYGEGITYWPLAEMVKSIAAVHDDDPSAEAYQKIAACCEEEAIADLLALASGVLTAVEEEKAPSDIAWAAREFAAEVAQAQPLVLVFEDIHWAEPPLLELIAQLTSIPEAPLLVLTLARPELLDLQPQWGGGQARAMTIDLEALDEPASRELAEALLAGDDLLEQLLERTEGNPLFIEEMARLLSECPDDTGLERVPETLQALIEARIDRLPANERHLVRVAAVIGRTFWVSALAELSALEVEEALESLAARELVHRAERSSLRGEKAYRFKHALIREVAYSGLAKGTRGELHELFAGWLERNAGEELLEVRAYHLDRAATLAAEIEGRSPALAAHAAAALTLAADRALSREANDSARKMLIRALDLEPTLERRYKAALAAVRMADLPTVAIEMERVLAEAEAANDDYYAGRALARLAEVALLRDGDLERTRALAERALELLKEPDAARFAALQVRSDVGWWRGDLDDHGRYMREALELARQIGREDLEAKAAHELALDYRYRGAPDEAAPLVARALELATNSGSARARGHALHSQASLHVINGDLEAAAETWGDAAALFGEVGDRWMRARTLQGLGSVVARQEQYPEAERHLREAIALLESVEDRGALCEAQRGLAQVLAAQGHIEAADRYAHLALQTVTPADVASQATTKASLAIVLARQGKRDEAETLFKEALESLKGTQIAWVTLEVATAYDAFLEQEGRHYPDRERLSQAGRLHPPGFAAVGLKMRAPVAV